VVPVSIFPYILSIFLPWFWPSSENKASRTVMRGRTRTTSSSFLLFLRSYQGLLQPSHGSFSGTACCELRVWIMIEMREPMPLASWRIDLGTVRDCQILVYQNRLLPWQSPPSASSWELMRTYPTCAVELARRQGLQMDIIIS